MNNSAVSGIAAGIHWCLLEPENGKYYWTWLEDVFDEATTAKKSVQLHIVPGNNSPSWLVADQSQSCDPVITQKAPIASLVDCVWVTFSKLAENLQEPESHRLPLPWSSVYTNAWYNFLGQLKYQFFSDNFQFVPLFVAIAIAGPTSESDKMILPTSANGSAFHDGSDVDKGWTYLINNSFPNAKYSTGWDQAFIDYWNETINTYDNIFTDVTLLLVPDDGGNLPELPALRYAGKLVGTDCSGNTPDPHPLSCKAKATVVSSLISLGGSNERAAMGGGFTASSPTATGYIGLPGVKLLTSMPTPPQSPPFLGGAPNSIIAYPAPARMTTVSE